MNASQSFEERLLAELRQVVAERPAGGGTPVPRRSHRTRLALAGTAGLAALATAAILAGSGNVAGRAYAVESRPDGAVTVSISSLSDAAGLQRSLREAGIPAVVDYAAAGEEGCVEGPPPPPERGPGEPRRGKVEGTPMKVKPGTGSGAADSGVRQSGVEEGGPSLQTSQEGGGGPHPAPDGGPKLATGVRVDPDGTATFTVSPEAIEPGQKLYITTSEGSVSTIGMAITAQDPC